MMGLHFRFAQNQLSVVVLVAVVVVIVVVVVVVGIFSGLWPC